MNTTEQRTEPAAAERVTAAMERLARILEPLRPTFRTEADLQAAIDKHLAHPAHGVAGFREVRLTDASRIDFVVTVDHLPIGVEVKLKGGVIEVARQVQRYARTDELAGVLLVTTNPRHISVPEILAGVPVRVVVLRAGAW